MTASNPQPPDPRVSDAAAESPGPDRAEVAQASITQEQAEAILAELKSIKQRLLWVLVIAGFFATRALFFHY
ncbi:hypothetical protein GFS31_03630 [Leptolyngbya sp. BL0902]|uniref:hypothetical protein n=1 Tax=Leptolyngbya sp. BL0902 TaxID=1115757 RepID=UPI0018E83FA1|nr:hypothetical protein [Leptolyngbya sp. BL0902]QQE63694.1 hypothetical protein GFS31_03630 [Leptolyngbya sp. BL0902]